MATPRRKRSHYVSDKPGLSYFPFILILRWSLSSAFLHNFPSEFSPWIDPGKRLWICVNIWRYINLDLIWFWFEQNFLTCQTKPWLHQVLHVNMSAFLFVIVKETSDFRYRSAEHHCACVSVAWSNSLLIERSRDTPYRTERRLLGPGVVRTSPHTRPKCNV